MSLLSHFRDVTLENDIKVHKKMTWICLIPITSRFNINITSLLIMFNPQCTHFKIFPICTHSDISNPAFSFAYISGCNAPIEKYFFLNRWFEVSRKRISWLESWKSSSTKDILQKGKGDLKKREKTVFFNLAFLSKINDETFY